MKVILFLLAVLPLQAQAPPGKITRAGVARAQAVVDSVFLDRTAREGTIEGGDWASYLMARLGVEPLPENTEILIAVDSLHIVLSGRLQDLPQEARAMIGPLAALVDSSTVLIADIVQLPAAQGLTHFRLQGVSIGGLPVPELILRYMLLDVGEHYPALTRSGRDLFVEIPPDARVMLVAGAVRLSAPSRTGGAPP
ncbi:MAG TPA: hypothetical protein VGQ73_08760 [Gemmatimonadales bacterium]|jgi:hypothetical protein|nr:hypothetical protein [Gemmatimonadales bacterium]